MEPTTLWIALASAFAAVASVVAMIWNGLIQRTFMRLSVRPHVDIRVTYPNATTDARIDLENRGLGPAILESVTLFIDDVALEQSAVRWAEAVTEIGFPDDTGLGFHRAGEILRAGGTSLLLSSQRSAGLVPAMTRLRIDVRYRSMYREVWSTSWRGDEILGEDRL